MYANEHITQQLASYVYVRNQLNYTQKKFTYLQCVKKLDDVFLDYQSSLNTSKHLRVSQRSRDCYVTEFPHNANYRNDGRGDNEQLQLHMCNAG